MLIRSQTDVFTKPIQKVQIYVPVDMTNIQKMMYGRMLYDSRSNLSGRDKGKGDKLKLVAHTSVTLRHISNHPILLNK